MKKLIYYLLLALIAVSCNDDDSLGESNVVSDNAEVPFEELVILLNIKTTDSTFLVVESVDSVRILVNNSFWARINSESIDTAKVAKFTVGNEYRSDDKINYLILAAQDVDEPEFNTAGDYAQFLNAALDLPPGEYACMIESFQVTYNDGTTQTYFPFKYTTFKVERDSRSAFTGEIEITID